MKRLMYDYARSFMNIPYRWGGDDPMTGFDCSGLVIELLKAFGYSAKDQTAHDLYQWCLNSQFDQSVDIGALAFYGRDGHVTHVAFCLSSEFVIEAGGGGSKTKTLQDSIDQNAYIRMRPIKYRKDYIGCYMPNYLYTFEV